MTSKQGPRVGDGAEDVVVAHQEDERPPVAHGLHHGLTTTDQVTVRDRLASRGIDERRLAGWSQSEGSEGGARKGHAIDLAVRRPPRMAR